MPVTDSAAVLAEALLGQEEDIAAAAARRINQEYVRFLERQRHGGAPPTWDPMAPERLRRITRELVGRGLRALRDGRPPSAEDLELTSEIGAERARQREPVDQMLESYRIGARELLGAIERVAVEHRAPAAVALRLSSQLWDFVDQLLSSTAAAHRQVELALARHDQDVRQAYLQGLLFGNLSAAQMRAGSAYGLRADQRYYAIRARPTGEHQVAPLARMLHPAPWAPGLLGTLDGDLVGVLPELPPRAPLPIGVGPAAKLASLPASFALASRALATAVLTDLTGPVTIEELSLLPAVVAEQDLGEALLQRRVDPVEKLGRAGAELLRTLDTYLDARLSVEQAARRLFLHPNTVRHRLRRYEQITQTDLRRPEHIAEVWWALRKRSFDARS